LHGFFKKKCACYMILCRNSSVLKYC
jgi:hypothetical protein